MTGGVEHVGLDLEDKMPILARIAPPPYREEWSLVVLPWRSHGNIERAQAWILKNLNGRFGIQVSGDIIMIFFESQSDFVLFNLVDGEEHIKYCH